MYVTDLLPFSTARICQNLFFLSVTVALAIYIVETHQYNTFPKLYCVISLQTESTVSRSHNPYILSFLLWYVYIVPICASMVYIVPICASMVVLPLWYI